MEARKNINLLEESDEDDLKVKTRKWYIINDQNNGQKEMKMIVQLNLIQK